AKPETQKYIPIAKALANQLLDMAEQFIKETDAATFAVNLNDQGIATSLMAEFQPTSSLGLKVAQLKGTEQPLLNGLPDEKYLFVGGYAVDPKVAGKIAADLLDPIVKELATLGEDAAPFQAMADAIKQQIAATSSASMGMVAPEGMLGQASLVQVVGVLRGDAKAIRDASRKQFQSQEQVMNMFAGQAGQMTTTYTANAKTVDGIALDQFKSQLNLDPQTPEAAQAQQALTMMYGPNGMTGYVGVLDDKTLISAAGVSDELLAGALTAAKAGNDTVGARQNIKAVAAQLPANRLAVWYIPLDVLVSTGLNYARQMGMQMQLQLPPDQPPIGMAVATQGNALGVESFIPAELVQNLVAAGMQIMMQMKGGGGAGGPGGL
ncbi:MAG: hypothetical protein ACREIT_01295, partial [Tepidisphaeraceae bacterium]